MMCVLKIRSGCLLPLLFSIAYTGCYKKGEPVTGAATFIPAGVTAANVTHTNYVAGVLKNNCSTCHGKDGSADAFWLNTNTYQNASEFGVRIVETIVNGSMPPVPRKPFSAADKKMLEAWINRGMPQ
jgi:mono/diheme cytochrome c family protein